MTASLARLAASPFPSQIVQIDAMIEAALASGGASDVTVETLFAALAEFPDHEPLAHALRVLASAPSSPLSAPGLQGQLRDVLVALPDTGVRRVLRGLERVVLAPDVLEALGTIVLDAMAAWPIERIAVICLTDRWLKNAVPQRRQVWSAQILSQLEQPLKAEYADAADASKAVEGIPSQHLLHLPGKELATFATLAAGRGCLPAWEARLAAFASEVLALMRRSPRSLSQANAEELLSRRVYTDPGHFLIELFQNAEDARASRFGVSLEETEATIRHDGVPFDAKDVVGVLSIGQTTKAREQIGFFGVGFKSVYEICERPQIYSDLFRFEIADVSIPRELAPDTTREVHETLLRLPYRLAAESDKANHSDEADNSDNSVNSNDIAARRSQMYQRALAVPPETLLTLQHLEVFAVSCGDQRRTVLRRETSHPQIVELWLEESQVSRHYRVASGRFAYDGPQREMSRAMETGMLVAFAIDEAGHPQALAADQPTLFSHLPTDERSGLRLMIHAHFALPVDRERLDLSSPWNRWALARAGTLLGDCVAQLCAESKAGDAQSQRTLAGILDVLPLAAELRHPAYQGLLDTMREGLTSLPMLLAAGGGWVAPSLARLVALPALEAALSDVLAGIDLDDRGTYLSAPLQGRARKVAQSLGTDDLAGATLVGLLYRHLSTHASGAPWPTPWLASGHNVLLAALGHLLQLSTRRKEGAEEWAEYDQENAALLLLLEDLPLLPDQDGLPRRRDDLWLAGKALRALYGPHRAFLDEELVFTPTPGQAALLDAMGPDTWGHDGLLADLEDAAMAVQLLDHAGAHALHQYLARCPHDLTAHIGLLPLFPVVSAEDEEMRHMPLVGEGVARAWLAPDAAFLGWLEALDGGCPPLVKASLGNALGPYLRRLGGEVLDLPALLDLLEAGEVVLTAADVVRLHEFLETHIAELSSRQCLRLAAAALFLDQNGTMRPLSGEHQAYIPHDEAVIAFAPDAPWLASSLRAYSYLQRLPIAPVGPRAVIRLLCDDRPGPLYAPGDTHALRRGYAYLLSQRDELLPRELRPLEVAPVWLDSEGTPRELAQLQAPATNDDVAAFFARFEARIPIESVGPGALSALDEEVPANETGPTALELVEGLGLEDELLRPDLPMLLQRLPAWSIDWSTDDQMWHALRALLQGVATSLPAAQLAPVLALPIFVASDGRLLPMGHWDDPGGRDTRAHLASGPLHKALSHGSAPLLYPDEASAWAELFATLELPEADVMVLVAALETDPAMATSAAAAAAREAFVALQDELLRISDASHARLAALPIWPVERGESATPDESPRLLPAADILVPNDIRALLGASLEALLVDGDIALLAEEAWEDAAALAETFAFDAPIAHLLQTLGIVLEEGAPLASQPAPFNDVVALEEATALLCEHRGVEEVLGLPLSLDVDLCLRKGPLWFAEGDAHLLASALPLRPDVADISWAEAVAPLAPGLHTPLAPARLLREILQAARDATAPKASDEARGVMDALYAEGALLRWLAEHLGDFVADEQLRGALGNAPLLKTAVGGYKSPRELLWVLDDDVAAALSLDAWRCHADIPASLQRVLQAHYQLEEASLDRLIGVLTEAHLEAQSNENGPRSMAILHAIAEAMPEVRGEAAFGESQSAEEGESEEAALFGRLARRHKLMRLRVETHAEDGGFSKISRLIFPALAHQPLLDSFLATPMPQVHPRYDTPALRQFFANLGAPAHLPVAQLKAILAGKKGEAEVLVESLDARLALAQYLAMLWEEEPSLSRTLPLANAAWVPNGEGVPQAPGALYWPSEEASALLGDALHLYPHPAFFRTVPEAIATMLPFRQASQARLADALAHLHESVEGASFALLEWLEQGLRGKMIVHEPVKEAFSLAPYLRDDNGVLQLPSSLICTPGAAWIGETRQVWSPGLRFSKLASVLGVPHRVGPVEALEYCRSIGAQLASVGGVALLHSAPGLQERLPRCLALLSERKAPATRDLPLLVEALDGTRDIQRASAPTLALPQPRWLIEVARDKGLDVWLPVLPQGAEEAAIAWLSRCGIPGLDGLMAPPGEEAETAEVPALGAGISSQTNRTSEVDEPGAARNGAPRHEAQRARQSRQEEEEEGAWSRLKRWWGSEPPKPQESSREEKPQRQDEPASGAGRSPSFDGSGGGRGARNSRLPQPEEHGRFFRARRSIDPQLQNDGRQWLADRTQAPYFGLGFSPSPLPYPYLYAPQLLAESFQRQTQRWGTAGMPRSWRSAAGEGAFQVALEGDLPAGENLFPLPLYARLTNVEAEGVRVIRGNNGQVFLMARAPTAISCTVTLDQTPTFEGDPTPFAMDELPQALLAPIVPDEDLPHEVLDWIDAQLDLRQPMLAQALGVRRFIQERYCYDPSYIEDPAVADWLARISRGRANAHIAALHAGRDERYLGRGVCYELGALACELMRRVGVPAAVSTGWTWEGSQLADADHMWAMALLPSNIGPRWLPIDAASTQDGRPLRVGRRPQGPWQPPPPKQRGQRPPEPEWGKREPFRNRLPPPERQDNRDDRDDRDDRGRDKRRDQPPPRQRHSAQPPRRAGSHRATPSRQRQQSVRKPPVAELIRVLRHIQRVSGETPTDSQDLRELCETILQNPSAARRLLRLLDE